ncbi:hypothetical protein [uncultured Clostridium sp.]|uniref:hypothetical protein n=1 Tax=uncultured Clostridium sp. TaxID=59620 RepID=UPI0026026C50|nr:hypothetical protein [uncultured Clostridium sp.]
MTPYGNVIDRFIRKIKQDKEYFCISSLTEEEFEDILYQRTFELLDDSLNEIQLLIAVQQNINFLDKNDLMAQFNFDLTVIEEDLISDMMVVKYFDEELVKLKTMQKYLGDDIKVFSPAAERTSFINMISYRRNLFLNKLSNYNTKDRLTGKFLLPY